MPFHFFFFKLFLYSLGVLYNFLHVEFTYSMPSYFLVLNPRLCCLSKCARLFLRSPCMGPCLEVQLLSVKVWLAASEDAQRPRLACAVTTRPHARSKAGSSSTQAKAFPSALPSHSWAGPKELGSGESRRCETANSGACEMPYLLPSLYRS